MMKLVIIADDFTGAMDTGVHFAKKGIKTFVTTETKIEKCDDFYDSQVLVIDTETRHLSKELAYSIVKDIVKNLKNIPNLCFYKKTDSTLRGNIGSEIEGFLDGLGENEAHFIPALPQNKRTTINGYHYVEGILLENTSFGKDPLNPIKESYIPNILASQSDVNVKVVNQNKYEEIFKNSSSGKTIYVYDCQSEDELKAIGSFLKGNNKLQYTCGCAGFAEILSNFMVFDKNERTNLNKSDKLLFISGSVNERSLKQVAYSKSKGYPYHKLTPEETLCENIRENTNYKETLNRISQNLMTHNKLLIMTLDIYDEINESRNYAIKNGICSDKIGSKIANNLGKLVKDIIDKTNIENLVIFGGDTLMGVANHLDLIGIIPQDEISLGVVYGKLKSKNKNYGINIVTKAGGFGDDEIIDKIENYILKE